MSIAMPPHALQLLLVDDDASAIQAMGRALPDYPDQRFATSGESALRLARESTPDLILLDLDMPGMSGFDVCAALKADPLLANVPVILATSHDLSSLLQATALRMGAAGVVTKPPVAARVNACVRAHLQARTAAD